MPCGLCNIHTNIVPSHHPRPTRRPTIVLKTNATSLESPATWVHGGGHHVQIDELVPLEIFQKGWYSDWIINDLGRIRGIKVPVGLGKIPALVGPGVGVPQVVPGTPTVAQTSVPAPIDRRDTTPTVSSVPEATVAEMIVVTGTWDDFMWHARMFPDKRILHESSGYVWNPGSPIPDSPPTSATVAPTTTSTDSEAPMDLGQLITDLGTTYIQSRYAPQPTAPAVTVQPALDPFGIGGDIIDYFTAPDGTVVPVKKKKKCRRRRRRLATKSDLGDLAALKAILGNGEAFKAWIATHSR